jgi:hypothetical protein
VTVTWQVLNKQSAAKFPKKGQWLQANHNHYPRFLLLDQTQDVACFGRYNLHQSGFEFCTLHEKHLGVPNSGLWAKVGTITHFLIKIKCLFFCKVQFLNVGRYSGSLRAGRSWDRIPVEARFSSPVQNSPGAHLDSYTASTGSFQGVKRPGRGVDHSPNLTPRLKKE